MTAPLRILVADDNPINLRTATRLLRDLGHSGVLVTDGEKALRALESQHFDLALFDVTMPVLDGESALKELRLRERSGQRRLPVIMVTGHDLPSDRQRLLEAGADGYVNKPISAESLKQEIQRVIRN